MTTTQSKAYLAYLQIASTKVGVKNFTNKEEAEKFAATTLKTLSNQLKEYTQKNVTSGILSANLLIFIDNTLTNKGRQYSTNFEDIKKHFKAANKPTITDSPMTYMVVIKRGKKGICLASFETEIDAKQYCNVTAKHLYYDLDSRYDYTTASKLIISYAPSNTYPHSNDMQVVEKTLYPKDYKNNNLSFHNQLSA